MRFRKIDNHKFQCVITQQEMQEKGFTIEDIIDERERMEAFTRAVLAEARYEFDFDNFGTHIAVQITAMPDGDVSLLICGEDSDESDESGEVTLEDSLLEFGKHLQNFKEIMQKAKEQIAAKRAKGEPLPVTDAVASVIGEQDAGSANHKKSTAKPKKTTGSVAKAAEDELAKTDARRTPIWVAFTSLEDCIDVCSALRGYTNIASTLYRHENHYYLRMRLFGTEHEIAGVILAMAEYGHMLFSDAQGGGVVSEHGTVLCAEHAIETLAKL